MDITTVLLIKEDAMDQVALKEHYLNLLEQEGIPLKSIQILPLLYNTTSKVLAKTGKAYLDKLITRIPDSVTKLIIADSNYYKFITKVQKVSSKYGAVVKGEYSNYVKFDCVYVPNYKSLFKQPENANLIEIGIKTIAGTSANVVVHSAEYGFKYGSDREILDALHKYPILAADIETTSLELDSDVVSIAFAWTKHDGVAIDISINGSYYTKKFIEQYRGKLVFHNGLFDAKLLIRNWWMEHPTDYEGMLRGVYYFRDIDDTMLMAYLAKNATTQVSLGLKDVALEYVGNYAIEIEDASKYSKKELLEYNLIDVLGTFYVYEKYAAELATRPYLEIMQPSIYPLLKMMLTGLPMSSTRVHEVHNILAAQEKVLREQIQENNCVIEFNEQLRADACEAANAKLKKLVKTIDEFADVEFNPGSHQQLSKLLFETHNLPILDTTKTGAPATGSDILEDLRNHTQDEDILDLLEFVQRLADVGKINGTFIKAFMREKDFLHGNLKLGGTQSGRLSSNNPNLTNLPAHGPMGKLIKSCVKAPEGWLFCGADFSALEERIGAILSKDPNRVKVYTSGFDGHSMRAYKYFGDQMEGIDPNDPVSINSIEKKYPELRRKSKGPTFALQYGGTWHTLWKRGGLPQEQAKQVEKAYREFYKISEEFNAANKEFMVKHGYVECAFGLKLRTPIIAQTVLGTSKTPYEAEAEVRSANNAVTQSWGMLLNRAMIATNTRIETAGYGTAILPINMIHDAGYFLVKDDPETVKFLNDTLIEEMEWNDDDQIRSVDVPMTASLEIGKSWDQLIQLPNKASIGEITNVLSTISGSD